MGVRGDKAGDERAAGAGSQSAAKCDGRLRGVFEEWNLEAE